MKRIESTEHNLFRVRWWWSFLFSIEVVLLRGLLLALWLTPLLHRHVVVHGWILSQTSSLRPSPPAAAVARHQRQHHLVVPPHIAGGLFHSKSNNNGKSEDDEQSINEDSDFALVSRRRGGEGRNRTDQWGQDNSDDEEARRERRRDNYYDDGADSADGEMPRDRSDKYAQDVVDDDDDDDNDDADFDDDDDDDDDDDYGNIHAGANRDLWGNTLIPNPLLDSIDPDGAAERFPELARDPRFWVDMLLFVAFLDFLSYAGPRDPLLPDFAGMGLPGI